MAQDNGKFYEDEDLERVDDDEEELDEENPAEDMYEEVDPEEDAPPMDDISYFEGLLESLRNVIAESPNLPLSKKKIINSEKCLQIIDAMRDSLPEAIQYGLQMFSERDRILGNAESTAMSKISSTEMRVKAALAKAKEDARNTLADAENEANAMIQDATERANAMVQDSEIVRAANEEARVIRNDARVEANEIILKANHDAYELLTAVEDELVEATKAVRRRRANIGDDHE